MAVELALIILGISLGYYLLHIGVDYTEEIDGAVDGKDLMKPKFICQKRSDNSFLKIITWN